MAVYVNGTRCYENTPNNCILIESVTYLEEVGHGSMVVSHGGEVVRYL